MYSVVQLKKEDNVLLVSMLLHNFGSWVTRIEGRKVNLGPMWFQVSGKIVEALGFDLQRVNRDM
jgi:hypothetical protein